MYGPEHNSEIEKCFLAKKDCAAVEVGIRAFQIEFSSKEKGYAWQKDVALKKSRLVRRRLVSPEEFEAAIQPAAPTVALDQEECAICCLEFAETSAMPVITLPGCHHAFHEACALQVRDKNECCPCCRAEVDWDVVLPKQSTPRGWKSCRHAGKKKA